jgi:hypothetical protein
MYYLIQEKNGDQCLVLELAGHEECKILEEGVTAPKVPHCERIDGRWRIPDKAKTRHAIRVSRAAAATLVQEVTALEDRIAVLEKLIAERLS